jgi:hypothetical protein
MAKIRSKDIIQDDLLAAAKAQAEAFIVTIDKMGDSIKDLGTISKKVISELDFSKAKDVATLNEEITKLTAATKDLEDGEKKRVKTKKAIKEITEEEIKQKIILQKRNRELKKQLEAQIILENKEIKTKQQAKEANKALRIVVDGLNQTTKEGKEETERLNAIIDQNTEFIKENSDTRLQQISEIGGYQKAIEAALEGTNKFGESISEVSKEGGFIVKVLTTVGEFFAKRSKTQDEENKNVEKGTDLTNKNTKALKRNTSEVGENTEEREKQTDALEDQEEQATKTGKALKAIGQVAKATGIAALVGLVSSLGAAFTQTREGGVGLQKFLNIFKATLGVLVGRLAESGNAIVDFATSFKDISLNLKVTKLEMQSLLSTFDSVKKAALDKEIAKLNKQIAELGAQRSKSMDRISEAFNGTGEAISENIDLLNEATQNQDNLAGSTAKLTNQIAELAKKEGILNAVEGNNALSFNKRQTAIAAAIVINEKRTKLIVKLANEELAIQKTLADAEFNNLKVSIDTRKLSADQILQNNELVKKLSIPSLQALTEATVKLKEAEQERGESAIATETLSAQLNQDNKERILDFSFDLTDAQIQANNRIIADDRRTFAERQKLAEENRDLSTAALKLQIETLNELGKEVDVDSLLAIRDPEKLALAIRALEQSEVIEGRTLELLKERLTIEQDIADQRREIDELAQKDLDVQREIETQQKILDELAFIEFESTEELEQKIAELRKKFDQEQLDNQKESLQERIDALETDSELRLDLEKELNQLLIDEQLKSYDEQLENQKNAEDKSNEQTEASAEKRKEIVEDLLSATSEISDQIFEKQKDKLDQQIEDVQESQDRLQELAAQGSEDAQKNLAQAEKKEAELLLERQRKLKQQQRFELLLTGIKTYGAKVDAKESNPLGSTIADITLLAAALQAIPLFWEGAENVGQSLGKPQFSGRDGHIVRVDGSERVMPGHLNELMGNTSNEEVAKVIQLNNQGFLQDVRNLQERPFIAVHHRESDTTKAIYQLADSIERSKPEPVGHTNTYDSQQKMMIDVYETKTKIDKHLHRVHNLFTNKFRRQS